MRRNIEKGFSPSFGEKERPPLEEEPTAKAAGQVEEAAEGRIEEEPKKKVSLKEFFAELKEEVVDSVIAFLKRDDKEVRKFEKTLQKSIEISKAAGEFYRFLIPGSLNKPELKYLHGEREIFERNTEAIEFLRSVRREMPPKGRGAKEEFARMRQSVLERGLFGEGKLKEIPQEDGGVAQLIYYRFKQKGGDNVIEEQVVNLLKEKSYEVSAGLTIKEPEKGIKIDLEQLLPTGYFFAPGEMHKVEYAGIKANEPVAVPVSLESYKGTEGSMGRFSARTTKLIAKEGKALLVGRVHYGDLTERGGILSLLHEVSHAWQSAYYRDSAVKRFEGFYKEASRVLWDLSFYKRLERLLKKEKITAEECEKSFEISPEEIPNIMDERRNQLKKMGIEIDEERFMADVQKTEKGELKVKDSVTEKVFIIKSDRLNQLIKDFTREERDAWAHAIRALRFLRKRGIDVEPQLKSLADFKEVVEPALNSYQETLDEMMESSITQARFTHEKGERDT